MKGFAADILKLEEWILGWRFSVSIFSDCNFILTHDFIIFTKKYRVNKLYKNKLTENYSYFRSIIPNQFKDYYIIATQIS